MTVNDAVDFCAGYFELDTKKKCEGFFYVDDASCGSGKAKYSFSEFFHPQKGSYAYGASLTSVTPTAVQMVFKPLPHHVFSDGTSSKPNDYDYKEIAKTCSDEANCQAYEFHCVDPRCFNKFPSAKLPYQVSNGASSYDPSSDHVKPQLGSLVFLKNSPKRLSSALPVSVEAESLIV